MLTEPIKLIFTGIFSVAPLPCGNLSQSVLSLLSHKACLGIYGHFDLLLQQPAVHLRKIYYTHASPPFLWHWSIYPLVIKHSCGESLYRWCLQGIVWWHRRELKSFCICPTRVPTLPCFFFPGWLWSSQFSQSRMISYPKTRAEICFQ